jgi:ribosomal-protein-alanine N-acetyltransferase
MTWLLRRAGVDDLDAIMAIEQATFATDAWSSDLMRAELRNAHTYYLVAAEAAVEGYAGLLAPRGSGQADIQTIAVVESARGKGLGRTLMNALLSEARTRGADEVFLEVRADNPAAQHLYESLGFERIDLRKNYYQPDGVDAIIMRLTMPAPTVVTA